MPSRFAIALLLLLLCLGCKGGFDPTGSYMVLTVQSSGPFEVGRLNFESGGTWSGKVGQLEVSGKWTSAPNGIAVTADGGIANPSIQADRYEPRGNRLIPFVGGVEAKHWYLEKG